MKKLIACLLTLAMLVGIVPAVVAADNAATAPKSLKILTIGENASRTSMQDYLQQVLEAEGCEELKLGHLYKAGYTINDYAAELSAEDPNYTLTYNYRGYWDYCARYTVPMAVAQEDWDYIVLHTEPVQSGQESEFSAALYTMISAVKKNATNPNMKIGWHINWPYQDGYDNEQFTALYGGKADTMYKAITETTEKIVRSNVGIDFLVPAGTAVLNAESSFIGDLQVDEGEQVVDTSNLNETGKLVTAYTFYAACAGVKLNDLKFSEAFLFKLSSAERKAIAEAVNNAIKTPLQVTQSSYKTEPTQYNVTVDGTTYKCLPGDTITIDAQPERNAGRTFQGWKVVKGNVTLGNAKALNTSFTVPAQDVEVKSQYTAMDAGQLMVGFARTDGTPSKPLNLSGYYDTAQRLATGRRTPDDGLFFSAVAISDGKQTNIMVSADFNRVPNRFLEPAREKAAAQLGISTDNIIVSATHTHSGPNIGGLVSPVQQTLTYNDDPSNEAYWYFLEYVDALSKACVDAVADLKPVSETKTKSVTLPGMNFLRHWRYDDGTMRGTNFAGTGGKVKGHVRDADNELQMIRFVRDDARDVLMVNWQGHNHMASSSSIWSHKMYSGDVFGITYRYLEKNDPDLQVAIYAGASANVHLVATGLTSDREKWGWPATKDADQYAQRLGDYILANVNDMTTVETGALQSMRQNHVAIHHMYEVDPVRNIEQDVVAIGGTIAFVTAGYEMFDNHGMDVKNASPYDMTFVLTSTQWNEYMADWQSFNYPVLGGTSTVSYEASEASCNFLPGTGEDLRDGLISMLNILYEN